MTNIEVPYGLTSQKAVIPDGIPVQVVDPECPPVTKTVEELIGEALDHPVGTARLEEMISKEDKALIIVNDQTRPGPNREMSEAVIRRLNRAGVPDGQIQIIVATGSHRGPTGQEIEALVGKQVHERVRVVSHDCKNNNVYLGTTKGGLPVYVDRMVAEASFIITTGLIAPHKAAGFSGGRKSIVPGVAGIETLRIHHSLPIRPFEPALGWMEENPFHQAAYEAARLVQVKFILNAVQDPHKQNVAVVAGDLDEAHKKGVAICRAHNTVECEKQGDLVIASPGGSPRDCNLYQGQKALATAELFAKKGDHTVLILVASAEDGIGPQLFQDWLRESTTPEAVIERFRSEGFDVGTNKAFEYARAMTKGKLVIVSGHVDPEQIRAMKMEWAPSLQAAVDRVCSERKPEQVIVLPKAVSIIPHFKG